MQVNELIQQNDKIPLYKNLKIRCHQNKTTLWTDWNMQKQTVSSYVRKNYFKNLNPDYEECLLADGFSVLHAGAEVSEVQFNQEKFLQFTYVSLE